MARVDLFETYEKHVKPNLDPIEIPNNDKEDLFHLDDTVEEKMGPAFDISDDVLEKLAQRVTELIQGGVQDEVNSI